MSAQENCALFWSIKRHFETKAYSYFKYGITAKGVPDLRTHKERLLYQKLSRMVPEQDFKDFIISQFVIRDGKVWVGDIVFHPEESLGIFRQWKSYFESFKYKFTLDVDKILEYTPLESAFSGSWPPIVKALLAQDIGIVSFAVIDDLVRFLEPCNTRIDDDIIWPPIYNKVKKLKPFLVKKYDRELAKNILKESMEVP